MHLSRRSLALLASGTLLACEGPTLPEAPAAANQLRPEAAPGLSMAVRGTAAGDLDAYFMELMAGANARLAASDADYEVAIAEYLTAGAPLGRAVFFRDVGNRQLGADFVPGDVRRSAWSGSSPDITYAVDQVDGAAPTLPAGTSFLAAVTTPEIDAAMALWDAADCSELPIVKNPDGGLDLGFVAAANGLGGSFNIRGDVQHAGWGDLNLPPPTLGVTFTLVFVGGDSNGDGKADVAFREIYYSDNFAWGLGTGNPIDIRTVAAHEAGHGLSQAHFGTLFRTDANGTFHFAPRALMNAGFTGVQQALSGTDVAGHCSLWGSWPAE